MPKALYIVGLIGWTAFMLLLPPWEGRSYFGGPGGWGDAGTFGLTTSSAPPWDPPTAFGSAITATVRWPWQPVTNQYYVEFDLTSMAVRWSLGLLAWDFW